MDGAGSIWDTILRLHAVSHRDSGQRCLWITAVLHAQPQREEQAAMIVKRNRKVVDESIMQLDTLQHYTL